MIEVDKRFFLNLGPFKLSVIADHIGCEISTRYGNLMFSDIKSLKDAGESDLSFLNNKKYLNEFRATRAGACIVPADLFNENNLNTTTILLKVKNPYYAYAKAIDLFYKSAKKYTCKIEKSAYVSPSAKIGKNCYIGHNVVIEDNARIGDESVIESGTVIDYGVEIGNRAMIYSNVSISCAEIGNDVVILPGARIGQDGFGFATEQGIHKKIYHIGKVKIGDNVEIGANTAIDRGSMNDTIIEDFCRIDNLVQIAHNVHIKRGAILAAQAGIAGSSEIGSYCALGGQTGISGHIKIADGVQISGQGGAIQNINRPGAIMGGTPAVPIRDWHRQTIIMKKLVKRGLNG